MSVETNRSIFDLYRRFNWRYNMQNIANLSRSACDASVAALSQTSCIEMLPQLIKYEPCQLIVTLSDSGVEIQKLSCEFVINDYHRCVGFTRAIAQMAD